MVLPFLRLCVLFFVLPQQSAFRYIHPKPQCNFPQRWRLFESLEVDPRRKDIDEFSRRRAHVPMVHSGDCKLDVISQLIKTRTLFLGTPVNNECANFLVAQLLFLSQEDSEKDITLYINSPGGEASACMAIYDTIQFLSCDVSTVCCGMAASMGAFLLGSGTPGKRKAFPNSRIMMHQPLGFAQGQATDMKIQANEILYMRSCFNNLMSHFTKQPIKKINEDCDRDFYMTPNEALKYGFIDQVIQTRTSHLVQPSLKDLNDCLH